LFVFLFDSKIWTEALWQEQIAIRTHESCKASNREHSPISNADNGQLLQNPNTLF